MSGDKRETNRVLKREMKKELKEDLSHISFLAFYAWMGGGRLPCGTTLNELTEQKMGIRKRLAEMDKRYKS